MKNTNKNRRDFLKKCAVYGLAGSTNAITALGALHSRSAVAANRPVGYRAIVNIYLQGGNDLNMLIPTDDIQYQRYRDIRGGLGLDRADTLGISSAGSGVTTNYGLHPATSGMKTLYDNGKLAFVANVGALKAPITREEFFNRTKPFPRGLFAHNSQSDFVIAGLPFEGERTTGWAGRIADIYNLPPNGPPLNISMLGLNLWQRGLTTKPFGYGGGLGQINNFRTDLPRFTTLFSRTKALEELHNHTAYDNVFTNEYARQYKESLETSQQFITDDLDTPDLATQFPSTRLGAQFKSISTLINSREQLGQNQQIFYAFIGGWDFHEALLGRQNSLLKELGDALNAFYLATEELGVEKNVTTSTVSDFGRTLGGNGKGGSDHGWGGTQMIMGGAVNGGKVYGEYPQFIDSDPHFLPERGNLIPTTSQDQISSTVTKWFGGFTNDELRDIFPNLKRFDANAPDLGLFNV